MRLRQVNSPASKAQWSEHFYNGELKVVNGEVETDNETWINLLYERGFRPIDEVEKVEEIVFGEVTQEEPVEPLGTQIAAQADTESEQERVTELIEESEKGTETVQEKEPVPTNKPLEPSAPEPRKPASRSRRRTPTKKA